MAMLFKAKGPIKHLSLSTNTLFFFNVVEGVGVAIPVVGGGVGVVRTLSSPRFNSALRFDSSLLHLKKIFYQNIYTILAMHCELNKELFFCCCKF